jgi:hypothetical protein
MSKARLHQAMQFSYVLLCFQNILGPMPYATYAKCDTVNACECMAKEKDGKKEKKRKSADEGVDPGDPGAAKRQKEAKEDESEMLRSILAGQCR